MFSLQIGSQSHYMYIKKKVLGNIWNRVFGKVTVIFYPTSPLTSAFNYSLFLFLLKKSAYCSEQISKFVVGRITLSSFDWLSLIWKIYHQPSLLEKSFHIIGSSWILEIISAPMTSEHLCKDFRAWLPPSLWYYSFPYMNSCEAPCLCPTFSLNVFMWSVPVLALILQSSIFPRCSQY